MDDSEDLLKVSALKWLADTERLEQLQKQCAGYTSEAGRVKSFNINKNNLSLAKFTNFNV